MGPSRLILCESGTAVLVGMRRALEQRDLPLRQTRTTEAALAELEIAPRSVLIAELTCEHAEAVLGLLETVARRLPSVRAMVVLARGMQDYESLVRSLGAVHVEQSARDGSRLVELAHRHLLRRQPDGPDTGRLTDNVPTQLPWGD